MTMHTSGPWEAAKSGIYQAGRGGICVAMRHPQAGPEYVANAPLLAAAPELLEALRGMLRRYREEPGTYTAEGAAARAAYAKATGEIATAAH